MGTLYSVSIIEADKLKYSFTEKTDVHVCTKCVSLRFFRNVVIWIRGSEIDSSWTVVWFKCNQTTILTPTEKKKALNYDIIFQGSGKGTLLHLLAHIYATCNCNILGLKPASDLYLLFHHMSVCLSTAYHHMKAKCQSVSKTIRAVLTSFPGNNNKQLHFDEENII